MISDNELQFRMLLSSGFRTAGAPAHADRLAALMRSADAPAMQRLGAVARLRVGDALDGFLAHTFRRTHRLLAERMGLDADQQIARYLAYCEEQPASNIDADGASFYRFVRSLVGARGETRLLSVCAIEYLLAALSTACSADNLGHPELGFGPGTERADGFLFVLAAEDFRSFAGVDARWAPDTGVYLAPTGRSGEFLWASMTPAAVACPDALVTAAPRALREALGDVTTLDPEVLQDRLDTEELLAGASGGMAGCCTARAVSP